MLRNNKTLTLAHRCRPMSSATTRDYSMLQCVNHAQISKIFHSQKYVRCMFCVIGVIKTKGSFQHALCDFMSQSIGDFYVWNDIKTHRICFRTTHASINYNWLVFTWRNVLKFDLILLLCNFWRCVESKNCLLSLPPVW